MANLFFIASMQFQLNPMKHIVAIAAVSLLIVASSQARVGETQKEITERYGEGKKADTQRITAAETFAYEKNEFYVEVVIYEGKSIMEIYAHRKGTTDDVIKELLKVNTPTGTSWHFDRKESKWQRDGKPKLVGYRWPGHPDFFCLKDVDTCAVLEKKSKPSASGL